MTEPKPNYKGTLEGSIRTFFMDSSIEGLKGMSDDVIRQMAAKIMIDLRKAGLIVTLNDGTDYAHQS